MLDAAEELFATSGFDGVTLRQIAKLAGVDVALTSYYFGPKLQLFDAVLKRRGEILNRARLDALRSAEAESAPNPPSIERVIEAFLRPLEIAQESEDRGWRNYCALIAYVNNSPVWGKKMIGKHFDKLVREFTAAMQRCFPEAPARDIFWCYHNLSGALSLTFADTGRIDILSENACQSHDFKSAYDRMIPFMAAGFREICGGH
ncbi:TetR family transcriptional regulator [Microbulbifer sp. ZGT114]|nr:TetR family transcriptional regulator [Microbulbifer sp. ZGT114]